MEKRAKKEVRVEQVDTVMWLVQYEHEKFCHAYRSPGKIRSTIKSCVYHDLLSRGLTTRGDRRIALVPRSLGYHLEKFRQWFYHGQKVFSKNFSREDALRSDELCGPDWCQRLDLLRFDKSESCLSCVCKGINIRFGRISNLIVQVTKYHIACMSEELRNTKFGEIASNINDIKLLIISCGEKRKKLRMSDEDSELLKSIDPSGKWKDDLYEVDTSQKKLYETIRSFNDKIQALMRPKHTCNRSARHSSSAERDNCQSCIHSAGRRRIYGS